MNISPLQHQACAADIPIERLPGNSSVSEPEKLAEVSRQFEAVLLRKILGDARKPVFTSAHDAATVGGGVYDDMITNQFADTISRSGALGLAHSLTRQLRHELKPGTDSRHNSQTA